MSVQITLTDRQMELVAFAVAMEGTRASAKDTYEGKDTELGKEFQMLMRSICSQAQAQREGGAL